MADDLQNYKLQLQQVKSIKKNLMSLCLVLLNDYSDRTLQFRKYSG